MEQFFLHLIAGVIRNTESTDKMHISKESIRNFQHKPKQLPQVHVWKPNQVRHSNSKYFKITEKLFSLNIRQLRLFTTVGFIGSRELVKAPRKWALP